MIHETILAIIIAFAISALLCPIIIPFLHKLKFGQQVRDDGPESHLKKQGTPTMGGLIILSSIIITSVFYIPSYPKIIPVLFVTVGFGIIGFLDDYIKIVMKRSEGLKPMQKLVGQFIITGIFAWYLLNSGEVGTDMLIPFTGGLTEQFPVLGIFFVPALFFIMLGTDNGVNLPMVWTVSVQALPYWLPPFLPLAIGEDMGISPHNRAVVGKACWDFAVQCISAKVFMGIQAPGLGSFVAASLLYDACPCLFLSQGLSI